MSTRLLKTTEETSREKTSEKIHRIAEKIEKGEVELSSGSDSVTLSPADRVEFEIEVEEEKDGDISLEIEVEWSGKEGKEEIEIK